MSWRGIWIRACSGECHIQGEKRTFVIFFVITVIFKGAVTTTWRQGGIEKVGWGILANHGGGYSYRLCRAGEQLTEECFQKTPLRSV